jgi:hypothetical protein
MTGSALSSLLVAMLLCTPQARYKYLLHFEGFTSSSRMGQVYMAT